MDNITFAEWRNGKGISSRMEEAFYHHMAAKYGGAFNVPDDPAIWEAEWPVFLSEAIKAALGGTD